MSFDVSSLLDLLILKEVLYDDVYRLGELDGAESILIIDVGAGIGDFSVLAASRFPRATVLAFEPSPSTFALLQANVTRNGLPNVEPHPLAIGTRSSYWLQRARPSATVARMPRDWGLLVTVTPDRYNPAIGYVYSRSPSLGRASW
jgi:Met-10+ like-protein